MKLLSQALDWLAFVDVVPSSLDIIVRFVAVVDELSDSLSLPLDRFKPVTSP